MKRPTTKAKFDALSDEQKIELYYATRRDMEQGGGNQMSAAHLAQEAKWTTAFI